MSVSIEFSVATSKLAIPVSHSFIALLRMEVITSCADELICMIRVYCVSAAAAKSL